MALEIIIPAYNAKDTLDTPLASIACQTARRRIFVTIVDDCSTEPFDEVVDRYRGLLNIRVLRTPQNGGAGVARNVGIEAAMGDYIMFLDADDALNGPIAVSTILHEVLRKNPDIMYTRFQQECDGVVVNMTLENNTWVHGKVWRREFLQEKKIFFPPIRYNEDSSFCSLARNLAEKKTAFDFVTYVWINNKNSTVRKGKDYYSEGIFDFLKGRKYTYDSLMGREMKEAAEQDFIFNLPTLFFMYVDFYNGARGMVNDFSYQLGELLLHAKYPDLVVYDDVRALLIKNYLKHDFKPRYGDYIPHMGMFEYFHGCMELVKGEENGEKN